MNKQEKIAAFNPSCIGLTNAGIFGFPFTVEEADYVVIPIPWESTASFGNGTQDAPAMIYEASNQLDFYFPDFPDVWKKGIAMTDIDKTIKSHSIACRKIVEEHIALLESGAKSNAELVDKINAFGKACNEYVSSQVERYRSQKKQVILLGGDHSTSLGNIKSLAKNIAFGILQIDAHLDLRNAYEDLNYSHASVMYNALQEENLRAHSTGPLGRVLADSVDNKVHSSHRCIGTLEVYTRRRRLKRAPFGWDHREVCRDCWSPVEGPVRDLLAPGSGELGSDRVD